MVLEFTINGGAVTESVQVELTGGSGAVGPSTPPRWSGGRSSLERERGWSPSSSTVASPPYHGATSRHPSPSYLRSSPPQRLRDSEAAAIPLVVRTRRVTVAATRLGSEAFGYIDIDNPAPVDQAFVLKPSEGVTYTARRGASGGGGDRKGSSATAFGSEVFLVEPAAGFIPPNSSMSVRVVFRPTAVGTFSQAHSLLHTGVAGEYTQSHPEIRIDVSAVCVDNIPREVGERAVTADPRDRYSGEGMRAARGRSPPSSPSQRHSYYDAPQRAPGRSSSRSPSGRTKSKRSDKNKRKSGE